MRTVARGVVVVCLVAVSMSLYAGPREPRESVVRKLVKTVRALGDLITVPIPAPKP